MHECIYLNCRLKSFQCKWSSQLWVQLKPWWEKGPNGSIPGARFSDVPNLFGCISRNIILFASSKRRGLDAWNFALIFNFYSLHNIWKDQLYADYGIRGWESYECLFRPEKFSGLSRKGPLAFIFKSFLSLLL